MERIINQVYIPNIEKHYPDGLAEMRGIADGAKVSLQDVVLLNARYDLARLNEAKEPKEKEPSTAASSEEFLAAANECTSAFFLQDATTTGDVINAQNWDMSARLWQQDAIVYLESHPDPSEGKPSLFLVGEAGQLGRSGMNSLGLGVTANSLMSTEDYAPSPDEAKPVMPISLLRRMILETSSLAEACTLVQNFPRHVSNNLTVATAQGFGMCFEITPHRVYKVYSSISDTNYMVHANHFTDPSFVARADTADRYPGGSSWFRKQRLEQLLHPYSNGLVSPEILNSAFSDHLSYPESLCGHPESSPDAAIKHLPGYPFRTDSATIASVRYNLTQRSVTVCKGPPCQGVFETFMLNGPRERTELLGHAVIAGAGKNRPETP